MKNCTKEAVVTERSKPIGPYSLGIKAGPFVFCSGQTGTDPATGKLVDGGVEAETRGALENLSAILQAAGTGMDRVVKTTVFLRDIADFAKMNAVYATFFPATPPARSTFQVAALPLGAAVEIECIALLGSDDDHDCCCSE